MYIVYSTVQTLFTLVADYLESFPVAPHLGERRREFFTLQERHIFQAGLTVHNIHSKLYLILNMSLPLTHYFEETNSKSCRHVGLRIRE